MSQLLVVEAGQQETQHHHAHHDAGDAVAVEGNAQHAYTEQEGDVHEPAVALSGGFIDTPQHDGHQQYHVHDEACVEGEAQRVDKEQLKPSAHLHDAWHDAVEHGGHQQKAHAQGHHGALGVGLGVFLVIIHQHDGGQTQQVEQVHADAEARKVGNEDEPAVAMGLVGMLLPFEDEPEDHSREQTAGGIYLTLHSAEPEGVTEGVDECAGEGGCFYRDELRQGGYHTIGAHEFACEVADAPEEEHDAGRTEEGAHGVDHACHHGGVAHKLGEQVSHEHEEGCAGRMSHFQLVGSGDKLRTVPKTSRGLDGTAVHKGRNGKGDPTHQVVYDFELFHYEKMVVNYFLAAKLYNFAEAGSISVLFLVNRGAFIPCPRPR